MSDTGVTRRRRHAFARHERPAPAGPLPGGLLATATELERLVEMSVDMLCVGTRGGRFIVVNPAWSQTLGWSEEELLGRRALELVHPDDLERTLELSRPLARPGGEVHDLETRFMHRDGSVRWLTWNVRSDGSRLYAVARDVTHRKRAEAAVREAQELFRVAFEDAPIGMAVWRPDAGPDFRAVQVNRAMCELLGRSASELIATPPREVVHPSDLGAGSREVAALLRGETAACSFEKRFVRGDGSVIWAHVRLAIARDAGTGAAYGICQFQETTDRHEAHEALSASEQRLRKIVQTAQEGVWVLDADDRTAFVNGRLAQMLGYRIEEMLGRPVYDFLAEHGRSLARARLAARRQGVADSQELRFIRKDGGEMWAILSGSPLQDDSGTYTGTLSMLVEITDRKQREQALRASEERYRNIVETTSEGVWMIDADHRTTYVNRRMAQMLGYSVEEMLGRPVTDFTPPAGQAPYRASLEQRRAGVSDQRELRLLRKDGSEIWALLSGSPLSDGNGGYGGALAMISDITERKRADEARALLAAIVESSPDAIFSTDLDGRVDSWNSAAERLYGYTSAEALGMDGRELAGPSAEEQPVSLATLLERGGTIGAYRTSARRRDGSLIEVEPSLSAITGPDGSVVGALAIVRSAGSSSGQ